MCCFLLETQTRRHFFLAQWAADVKKCFGLICIAYRYTDMPSIDLFPTNDKSQPELTLSPPYLDDGAGRTNKLTQMETCQQGWNKNLNSQLFILLPTIDRNQTEVTKKGEIPECIAMMLSPDFFTPTQIQEQNRSQCVVFA